MLRNSVHYPFDFGILGVRMSSQVENNQQQTVQSTATQGQTGFNFDQWAGAVKRQMIESLKRRGAV